MNFSTPVELPSDLPRFTQADELLLMGSCFATNIGALLADARFRPDVNPFGVLYNPLSVSTALRELVTGRLYKEEDLFFFRECWHSSMHHGDFSSPSAEEVLQRINIRLQTAHERIHHLNCLMLTFGTAWVYEQKSTGHVVANCHKSTGVCLYPSPAQRAGDCIGLYLSLLRFDCSESEVESDSYGQPHPPRTRRDAR